LDQIYIYHYKDTRAKRQKGELWGAPEGKQAKYENSVHDPPTTVTTQIKQPFL
jgi:hypothetical protein